MIYNGSGHCGTISFTVEGDVQQVIEFCPDCGCAPLGFGTDPKGNAVAAINVRCLPDVGISTLKIVPVDGRSA